ncbi:MAG: hydroxyacid dehydrogenase [Caldilineales bacterium]|nr:hydroxyacid dehydrogenase [Caldilineales bacterium]
MIKHQSSISSHPVVAIAIGQDNYDRMFTPKAWANLNAFAEVVHHPDPNPAAKPDLLALLPAADAIITSWDVAALDADVLAAAPNLRAMAHMGGSVKRFVSEAVWERGVSVTSAGLALAIDVAETTLGLMIVGMKRVWPLGQHVREGGWRETSWWPARELFAKEVGIIGASNVGRHVITLLQNFSVHILLYDPFVSAEDADRLGVEKVELDDLLQRADVISLHAPSKPDTFHLLNAERLALMKDDALLINTARGTLIDEQALIRELETGRFFAFLDVTDPEPPSAESPLRSLPNVVVIPHIAGCIENCGRMGELAVEELRRFFAGEPPIYPVRPDMFARIG